MTGRVQVPRPLWAVSSTFAEGVGLPIFDMDGKVVGALTTQEGPSGASTGEGLGLLGMLSGEMPGGATVFLLQADILQRTIPQAMAKAQKALKEAKEESEEEDEESEEEHQDGDSAEEE